MHGLFRHRINRISDQRGEIPMNVSIPQVICMDCHRETILLEGTKRRTCPNCENEIDIEVIDV